MGGGTVVGCDLVEGGDRQGGVPSANIGRRRGVRLGTAVVVGVVGAVRVAAITGRALVGDLARGCASVGGDAVVGAIAAVGVRHGDGGVPRSEGRVGRVGFTLFPLTRGRSTLVTALGYSGLGAAEVYFSR